MPSRLDAGIKAAVARHISRDGASSSLHTPTALDLYLTDPSTRNRAYTVALSMGEEDHPRRGAIGRLLLSYIVSFPPNGEVLNQIETMCLRAVAPGSQVSGADAATLESLRALVKVHLRPQPVNAVRSEWGGGDVGGLLASHKAPQFTRASSYLPPTKGMGASGKSVTVTIGAQQDEHQYVDDRNRAVVERKRAPRRYVPAMCRPYVDQTPLFLSASLLEEQVYVLGTYHEGFSTNAVVVQATNAMIKLLCDGYVRKLPLCSGEWGYSMLREVSMAFVRSFLKLTDSEYSCCRLHVYTLLTTLALHLQLVDPHGVYVGLGAGLENELRWLIGRVVEKQTRMPYRDDQLWLGALKCALCCVHPSQLSQLDARALRIWMSINEVATCHPHIYSVLAKALCHKLMQLGDWDGDQLEVLCASGLTLPLGRVVAELGSNGVVELVDLYRNAQTVAARLHLFSALFAAACDHYVASPNEEVKPGDRACCLRFLVGVGMHWHFHTLVLYQSHSAVRSLPQQLRLDMDAREVRDLKRTLDGVLGSLFELVAAQRKLPELITNMISYAADDIVALNQVGKECCKALPDLVKEDSDGSLTRVASHTVHHLLRILRSQKHAAHTGVEDASERIIQTMSKHASTKVRGVVVDVLGPHSVLCRTNPAQAACYVQLLQSTIEDEKDIGLLMGVYHVLVGSLVVQTGTIGRDDGDVSSVIVAGALQVVHGAADLVGSTVLWPLYWGLRRSELYSVQRARHVLLSILASLEHVGKPLYAIYAWSRVMSDPYPPAALVGAHRIIRIAAVHLYERYEGAVNQAQASRIEVNPYRLAASIWSGVEAEARGLSDDPSA